MRTHRLTAETFGDLCAGPADRQAIDALKATQHSKRRLHLDTMFQRISESPECQPAMDILADADGKQAEVVADLLLHPSVGVWLVRALRSDSELDYLNCVAASAGIRTGVPFEIPVPVYDGFACLPTIGSVAAAQGPTTIHGRPAGLVPSVRHQTHANDIGLTVCIEDTDPYREFTGPVPAHPLDVIEVDNWRRLLDEAWAVLTHRHTAYAEELSAGLTTLVPITSGRKVAGASARAAFGALALSAKDSPIRLADVLVHELQHSKLNAVLDVIPLVENDSEARWYAPWRTDPRPLTGVLHGIYAFASVVEFWHVERRHLTDPDEQREADLTFAYRRHQVRESVDSLSHAEGLTSFGRRLVDAAGERISACENAEVPADVRQEVARLADSDRAQWQRRNGSQLHGVGVAVRSD